VIALELEEVVARRRYARGHQELGVAEEVVGHGDWIRGDRRDETEPRTSRTIYWRPVGGPVQPWRVIDVSDATDDRAAWETTEARLRLDANCRWEKLPLAALG
jgi:hypothetical protein